MIVVEKKDGIIKYSFSEIALFIEEQIRMIPGIKSLGKNNIFSTIREKLGLTSRGINIHQFTKSKIMIEISVAIDGKVNYAQIENEINTLLKYSLQKKFGLEVSSIDIYVQDFI